MGRIQEREAARREKNALSELCKVQRKFMPDLFELFEKTADPRNPCYITYPNRMMLGQMYFKGIAGIVSMQGMTQAFNNKKISGNLSGIMGCGKWKYLPHHVTENEYLERLDPGELEEVIWQTVYGLIRRRTFEGARYKKRWVVIFDATQTYSGDRCINGNCLERHFDRGTENERINYHIDVLEAKLWLGDGLVSSLGSEFIENDEKYRQMSDEKVKQDCERKAFVRLAKKIKQRFPRLPILLLADSLYATKTVMDVCREYKWEYLIRFKDGSIPYIADEWNAVPERESSGSAEYVNGMEYEGHSVNELHYREEKIKGRKPEVTEFQWITSMKITERNAEKMAGIGRLRWKIENEGFNRQKNWDGDITHACSHNANALKNHYLMRQISDLARQLYEWFFLKRNGIKRAIKNVSPVLLACFGGRLTGGNTFKKRLDEPAFN